MDPTTFFCRHHVLQLFSKNIGAAHATKCCQNSWNGNFADFVDFKKKNQVWQIWTSFTLVPGFILCTYMAGNFQVANSRYFEKYIHIFQGFFRSLLHRNFFIFCDK